MERLRSLKASQITLESFLERWCDAQKDRVALLEGVEKLDTLVGKSRRGSPIGLELRGWMDSYNGLAESPSLTLPDRRRISEMILELSSRLPTDASPVHPSEQPPDRSVIPQRSATDRMSIDAKNASSPFAPSLKPMAVKSEIHLTTASVAIPARPDRRDGEVAQRRIVLRRPAEKMPDLLTQFEKFTREGLEYALGAFQNNEHILTRLDDILATAVAHRDTSYLHLAGSMIYFLKISGYLMDPYVKRLKEIEKALLLGERAAPQSKETF